jgi:hypothetical protein
MAGWQMWDRGIDDHGITVNRNGKSISRSPCVGKIVGDWSLDDHINRIKAAGIPEPSREDDEEPW